MTHAQPTQSRIILRQTHNWLKSLDGMTMNFVLRLKNKFFVNKVYWGIVKYFREQDKFFH